MTFTLIQLASSLYTSKQVPPKLLDFNSQVRSQESLNCKSICYVDRVSQKQLSGTENYSTIILYKLKYQHICCWLQNKNQVTSMLKENISNQDSQKFLTSTGIIKINIFVCSASGKQHRSHLTAYPLNPSVLGSKAAKVA